MKNYCVYVHIFPNGKKYYGISKNTDKRWKNGKGYKGKPEMYKDILKYGWNNIEHIILKENLNFYEAQKIENELIYKNSTNDKKSKDANYQNRDRNNDRRSQRQYEGSDDGMSYNPFAALLKK